jgi:hypothetical protein
MVLRRKFSELESLAQAAYAAFDRGDLVDARERFDAVLERAPKDANYHYMQGLVCKYLRDWPRSLAHNRRSIELRRGRDEASLWNAAIAATALGEWAEARRLWADCGIRLPDGDGSIDGNFGVCSVRLNAWGEGETLYARRIDPVRARLLNIPLPESGYRRGDIVLHDGARTGERPLGDGLVPVFNVLQRLQPSEFQTFTAFVTCPTQSDLDELLEMRLPGIDHLEDWTSSIVHYCMRCSYGTPHRHRDDDERPGWDTDRNIGIAAQSRVSVERLLEVWAAKAHARDIDGIESRETVLSSPPGNGRAWWDSPDHENEDGEQDSADAEKR